jgi:hypothetical protein
MDLYVFFISLHFLHMFPVLFTPMIRSTNCRVQPYLFVIVIVCEKLDNPLEQVLTGTPSHYQHYRTNCVSTILIHSTYLFITFRKTAPFYSKAYTLPKRKHSGFKKQQYMQMMSQPSNKQTCRMKSTVGRGNHHCC